MQATEIHAWPGDWTHVAPQVEDNPPDAELVWAVRGHPFHAGHYWHGTMEILLMQGFPA